MSITAKQADELYPLIDAINERTTTIRDDILSGLNDPDVKGSDRSDYVDDLESNLGDLRVEWDELVAALAKLKL